MAASSSLGAEAPDAPELQHEFAPAPGEAAPAMGDEIVAPPYDKSNDITQGVSCYICTTFTTRSWASLLEHLRAKHKLKRSLFKGTYLLEQAKPEFAAKAKAQYQGRKAKGVAKCDESKAKADATVKVEDGAGAAAGKNAPAEWKEMTVWVLCAGGVPVSPLQCSLANPTGANPAAPRPSDEPSPGAPLAPGSALAPPAPRAVEPTATIGGHALPVVKIRQKYLDAVPPKPSLSGGRSGGWPVAMKQEGVTVKAFQEWLEDEKCLKDDHKKDHLRGVARLMHMLETDIHPIVSEDVASDPRVLVSMYIHDTHKAVFKLPFMHPIYTWTRKLMDAFKSFCEWQIKVVGKRAVTSGDPKWSKYKECITLLVSDLSDGVSKRIGSEKDARDIKRNLFDAQRVAAFPPVAVMQTAVHKASDGKARASSLRTCQGWA